MKLIVSGSSGLIGSAICEHYDSEEHTVFKMKREKTSIKKSDLSWDPLAGNIEISKLEGSDAVVHLSGENIGSGRWTARKKIDIFDSRIKGTQLLCESLAKLVNPPKVLVSASAIGYYGNRGDELLDENSNAGKGFLADLCQKWELAAEPAAKKGIRVVYLRSGIVLSSKGGALYKMLFPFKLGLGGKLGSGLQYMSWISIDDMVGVIDHVINNESISGPINIVTPNPVTNKEFTRTLGKVISRPTIFPLPTTIGKILFGEMAEEMIFSSTRVTPKKLLSSGYQFQFPDLEEALHHVLIK